MNNITNLKFKDEDDGDIGLISLTIEPVENGYILEVSSDDLDGKYIYATKKDLLVALGEIWL